VRFDTPLRPDQHSEQGVQLAAFLQAPHHLLGDRAETDDGELFHAR
jgi:hypothetical protein